MKFHTHVLGESFRGLDAYENIHGWEPSQQILYNENAEC